MGGNDDPDPLHYLSGPERVLCGRMVVRMFETKTRRFERLL